MKIGDLVKCKLGIYGQGVIIEMLPSDKSPYHKRITVYWLIPTKTGIHTQTVLPSELEKICK